MADDRLGQLMDRIERLETMMFLPPERVPGDLNGRLWRIEDQLASSGALNPYVVPHLPLLEADDPLRLDVIDSRLALLEHLCDAVLKGWTAH